MAKIFFFSDISLGLWGIPMAITQNITFFGGMPLIK